MSGWQSYTKKRYTVEKLEKMKKLKIPYHWRNYLTLNNAAVVVAFLIALSWLWGTVTTLQKNFTLQQQVDDLDQQVQISEIQNANLAFQQQYYKSNEYLELAAREKLNKAAPGEKLILLPESPQTVTQQTTTPIANVEPSNFAQWMRFFFGKNGSGS